MLEIVEENPLVAVFFYDDSKASAKVCLIICIHVCNSASLKLGFIHTNIGYEIPGADRAQLNVYKTPFHQTRVISLQMVPRCFFLQFVNYFILYNSGLGGHKASRLARRMEHSYRTGSTNFFTLIFPRRREGVNIINLE